MAATTPPGVIRREADEFSVRFERYLDYPVTRVWDAISQPAEMARWLADVSLDPRPGGTIEIRFFHADSVSRGNITRINPPTLLEYTWQENGGPVSLVRWELFEEGAGKSRLVLTHLKLDSEIPSFAAGWHTHLDLLGQVLDGLRPSFSWDDDWWKSKLPLYPIPS